MIYLCYLAFECYRSLDKYHQFGQVLYHTCTFLLQVYLFDMLKFLTHTQTFTILFFRTEASLWICVWNLNSVFKTTISS